MPVTYTHKFKTQIRQPRNLASKKLPGKNKRNHMNNRSRTGKNLSYISSQTRVVFKRKLLLKQIVGLLLGVTKMYRQSQAWLEGTFEGHLAQPPRQSRAKASARQHFFKRRGCAQRNSGWERQQDIWGKTRPGLCSVFSGGT